MEVRSLVAEANHIVLLGVRAGAGTREAETLAMPVEKMWGVLLGWEAVDSRTMPGIVGVDEDGGVREVRRASRALRSSAIVRDD